MWTQLVWKFLIRWESSMKLLHVVGLYFHFLLTIFSTLFFSSPLWMWKSDVVASAYKQIIYQCQKDEIGTHACSGSHSYQPSRHCTCSLLISSRARRLRETNHNEHLQYVRCNNWDAGCWMPHSVRTHSILRYARGRSHCFNVRNERK